MIFKIERYTHGYSCHNHLFKTLQGRAQQATQPYNNGLAQPELQMVAETQPSNVPHIMYVQYYVDRTKTQSIHLL